MGFTLSELLIALALIGLIATFAVGKLLQAVETNQKNAIFKEAYASIYEIFHKNYISGVYSTQTGAWDAARVTGFIDNIQSIKRCYYAAGCWDTTVQGDPYGEAGGGQRNGVILANGATIIGFSGDVGNGDRIAIDWNGAAGPNQFGQDQLMLYLCYGPYDCMGVNSMSGGGPTGPGVMGPAGNRTFFNQIFKP